MKAKLLIVLTVMLCGCTSTAMLKDAYDKPGQPGYITLSKSEFDNRQMVSMEPAFLGNADSYLLLGVRWQSKFDKNRFMMVAEWTEAKNFDPDSSLDFNVDGQFMSLEPVNKMQYGVMSKKTVMSGGLVDVPVDLGNRTKKQFWVTRSELQRLINADKVIVRVELLESYMEERLEPSENAMSTYNKYPYIWAKAGFKKFLENLPSS